MEATSSTSSTSTTGDEASLAIRPLIGSMLQSLGGLAYSVYATPWYLISSSTALGLDALWRLTSRRETPAARIERENNFRRKLDEFAAEDCADLERLKLIECSGVDKQGRPVVWITGRHLPAVGMDLERIKWFIYTKLQRVAERGKFVIVYMHTDATWEDNAPGIKWIRKAYQDVPSSYQDNLQRFYVVHPGLYLRSLLMMMGPFTTGGFWEKLEYIDRVEFLWEAIPRSQCRFHDFVMEHDKELETQPLMDYGMCVDPMTTNGELSGYLNADHGMGTARHDRHRYPEY